MSTTVGRNTPSALSHVRDLIPAVGRPRPPAVVIKYSLLNIDRRQQGYKMKLKGKRSDPPRPSF